MLKEPAVVHADQCREFCWGSDVVRAVNEIDLAQPTIGVWPARTGPQTSCKSGGKREASFAFAKFSPKAQHIWMQVDIITIGERCCEVAHGPADPGSMPVKRAGVKSNSHSEPFSHPRTATDGLGCWRSFSKV